MTVSRDAVLGATPTWLFDMDIGGRKYRFATQGGGVTVTNAAGDTLVYTEGLSDPQVSPQGIGGGNASIGLEIDSADDWAELEARFTKLHRQKGTLRRYYSGQVLEEAEIILEGLLFDPEYGASEEPLTISLVRRMVGEALITPTPQMVVDSTTWGATRDTRLDGTYYPLVWGHPGNVFASGVEQTPRPAVPALWVGSDILLVAGHRIEATSLEIWDMTAEPPARATVAVTHTTDLLGRTVAICNISQSGLTRAKGREYYSGHSLATGGGLRNPRRGGVLRGAGDLLEYLLETYTNHVLDTGAIAVQAEFLNAVKIDTWLNTPVNIWDWINRTLLPILPITPRQGPNGLYFQQWRWDATVADVQAYLSEDLGHIERVGPIVRAGIDQWNEIALSYAHDRATGKYSKRVVITGEPGFTDRPIEQTSSDTDSRVSGNYACLISQEQIRQSEPGNDGRIPQELQSAVIWDAASAGQIILWLAAEHALPKRLVPFIADLEWAWLDVGQIVAITASRVSLSDSLAIITDKILGGPTIAFQFTLLDDPVQTIRNV